MGLAANILLLVVVIIVVMLFYPKITLLLGILGNQASGFGFPNANQSTVTANATYLQGYALGLINRDRSAYGLPNVTLSPEPSAQQHAYSMLSNNYFSHWDIYGMKPYMRYTLVGGTGAVQENIAYTKSEEKACIASLCSTAGNINVTQDIGSMEYNMMYNDSACCNNGHRDNILDPNHNQVSIGIAYNGTSIYLVEDFIDNYISWLNGTPSYSGGRLALEGSIAQGYNLSSIEISYDPAASAMSRAQLDNTSEYGYGNPIAGVVSSPSEYYPGMKTIVASAYYVKRSDFFVSFGIDNLTSQYGPGEYTIEAWLDGPKGSFLGSTYTVFVGQDGPYTPGNV